MRRWGWFVAVWGPKPADGLLPPRDEDTPDEEEEDEERDERWWGLWQADEIRKLADWLAIKNGLADGGEMIAESDGNGMRSNYLTPLSDATDTEDEDGSRAISTPNELRALVGSLKEYAEVLDWRAWRMEEEPGVDDKENGAAKKNTKAAQIKAVSPANFYGQ
jgi:hypothetical protein